MAIDFAEDFAEAVCERQSDRFDSWLARATASTIPLQQRFATRLCGNDDAVKAAVTLRWSIRPIQGQINR